MIRKAKSRKAISTMMGILFALILVVIAFIIVANMYFGLIPSSGGKASLTVNVPDAKGSDDGTTATLRLVLSNNGDGTARVYTIYIIPKGSTNPTSGYVVGGSGVLISIASSIPSAFPTSPPSVGFDIPAKKTSTLLVSLSGDMLYPGVSLQVVVVYYDLGSNSVDTAVTTATLR